MTMSDERGIGALSTEARNPEMANLDQLSVPDLVAIMHAADREAVAAVESQLSAIASAIEQVARRIEAGGRLFYVGAGTSGRLGVLDAAECPPTYNSPPGMVRAIIAGGERALLQAVEGAEDDPSQAARDLRIHQFDGKDTLVGIAASGRTPYVLGALRHAGDKGAWTIGVSCVPGSAVAVHCDLPITPATGAEIVAGSTRMKAGTATKLVLNMLSTGVMIRLGYVYGNFMVNLQTTNEKLLDRGHRIIATIANVDLKTAERLLSEAGSVRVAIVMHRLEVDRLEAERRLEDAAGRLRSVIG